CRECGTCRLAEQARRTEHAAGTAAALLWCGTQHRAVVGRLENPEAEAAQRHAPADLRVAGMLRQEGEGQEPHGKEEQADPAEQSGRMAVGEPSGERCCNADRQWPGRDE